MALTPEQQKLVNSYRQELANAGITPEMQQLFKTANPQQITKDVPKTQGPRIGPPPWAKGATSGATASTADTLPVVPKIVDFKAAADNQKQKAEVHLQNIRQDPKYKSLIDNPPSKEAIDQALASTSSDALQKATAAEPAQAAPAVARPYRIKISGDTQSFQIVNGKWQQVDYEHWARTREAKPLRAAPMYLINTLNAVKKKVDAQRAAGNLTDGIKSRGKRL